MVKSFYFKCQMINQGNLHDFFEIIRKRFWWNIITVALQLWSSWFIFLNIYLTSNFKNITKTRFMKGINSIPFATNKAFQWFNKMCCISNTYLQLLCFGESWSRIDLVITKEEKNQRKSLIYKWSSLCWYTLIMYMLHVQTHFFKTKWKWSKKVFKIIQFCYFFIPSSRTEMRQPLFLRVWCIFPNWIYLTSLVGAQKAKKKKKKKKFL